MTYLAAFVILFLLVIAVFLGQMAIQIIKIERRVTDLVEVLEEEIIDVFGTSSAKNDPALTADKPLDKNNPDPKKSKKT